MQGEEPKSKIKWWMFLIVFLVIAAFFISYRLISEKKSEGTETVSIAEKAKVPENYPFPVYNDSAAQIVEQKIAKLMQEGHGYVAALNTGYYQLAIETQDSSLCGRITDSEIRQLCLSKIQ